MAKNNSNSNWGLQASPTKNDQIQIGGYVSFSSTNNDRFAKVPNVPLQKVSAQGVPFDRHCPGGCSTMSVNKRRKEEPDVEGNF